MADEAAAPAVDKPPPVFGGKPKPSPIRIDLQEQGDSEIHSNSSPLGAALLNRKVERQTHPELQSSALRPTQQVPDSPGWESRVQQLKGEADPTQNSSPQGAALLARKMERQKERLDRPMPRSGDTSPGSGELQKPPPRSSAS